MRLRLLKPWNLFTRGTELNPSPGVAELLIGRGFAEPVLGPSPAGESGMRIIPSPAPAPTPTTGPAPAAKKGKRQRLEASGGR